MVDRAALQRALQSYSKIALARHLGITPPTLRAILRGHDPHPAIAAQINQRLDALHTKPAARGVDPA